MPFILFILSLFTFLPLTAFLLYNWYLTEDLTCAKHLMLIWISLIIFIIFLTVLIRVTGNSNILFQDIPEQLINIDY
ncbi:hypothetical protein ACFRAE_04200 [Sphingobacterium sp. HJSM2_6]|uniref:hypothetical protein n=1 Tax=Sphingobacterium sp. HJSM2_6 TaxID=3366264 RepID=UPI003BD748FF